MFGLYDGKGAVKTGPCRLVKVRCSLPLIRPSLLFGLPWLGPPGSAQGASLAFGGFPVRCIPSTEYRGRCTYAWAARLSYRVHFVWGLHVIECYVGRGFMTYVFFHLFLKICYPLIMQCDVCMYMCVWYIDFCYVLCR